MGFTATFKKKYELPGGMIVETGTWAGAAVTTGNVTADATTQPEIAYITRWYASDDADNAVVCATDGASNVLKLTFTADDTGKYTIVGKAK